MKLHRILLPLTGLGLGTALLSGLNWTGPAAVEIPSKSTPAPTLQGGPGSTSVWGEAAEEDAASLFSQALAECDPARRTALFRRWAALVDLALAEQMMAQLGTIQPRELRFEAAHALLAVWTKADMGGVAQWFSGEGSHEEVMLRMEASGSSHQD